MSIEKVIRDGRVAVLVSPGYGAGWSSWGGADAAFCPAVVAWVEGGKVGECPLPSPDFYTGGAAQLTIVWVECGRQFRITEYDGSEGIEFRDLDDGWVTA